MLKSNPLVLVAIGHNQKWLKWAGGILFCHQEGYVPL